MQSDRTGISYAEFVAMIGDIEHAHGMCLYPEGHVVRAKLVRITNVGGGRPGAVYKIPGYERCALIMIDQLTHHPYFNGWVDCCTKPAAAVWPLAA